MTVCLLWQKLVAEMATDHGQCTNDNHDGIRMGQLLHGVDSYISFLIWKTYADLWVSFDAAIQRRLEIAPSQNSFTQCLEYVPGTARPLSYLTAFFSFLPMFSVPGGTLSPPNTNAATPTMPAAPVAYAVSRPAHQ